MYVAPIPQRLLLAALCCVALFSLTTIHAFSFDKTKACNQQSESRLFATNGYTDPPKCKGYSVRDSWNCIVLGDLHMEDDMTTHEQARHDCLDALRDLSLMPCPPLNDNNDNSNEETDIIDCNDTIDSIAYALRDCKAGELSVEQLEILLAKKKYGDLCKCNLVSLGDLGRKDIRHEPGDAGTTKSFLDAKHFFDGFGLPFDLVTGNHDLEGLDEFQTDQENLNAWMKTFEKDTPHFSRYIGEKTLILGVSTTRFRSAPFSSHEVHVDDEQLKWFLDTVEAHPESEGWKILVFSHAPIMGSNLRVLQNVHVVNGCAWLNHCSEDTRNSFIRCVKANPQIKMWFSGHFHLSHDYQDAISSVGTCTFVQAGVMGPVSTRDGRRQSRLVQGCSNRLKIYTINHHIRDEETGKANVRLDVTINLDTSERIFASTDSVAASNKDWFQAYTPNPEDGCYIEGPDGSVADAESLRTKVCWWHMADGKVLGLHEGQLIEYDSETLSPLGVVVNSKTLGDRDVLVVEEGTALVLVDEKSNDIEVIHPNDDGSYWRKFQRNKKVRQEEKAREAVAKLWLEKRR